MNYNCLSNDIILHSKAVAEVMYKLSECNGEMYVLGLLHDIGKLYGSVNHATKGSDIAKSLGFKYHKEILFHGVVQEEYQSCALDILNAADLSVDSKGHIVGYKKRIEDIAKRYGDDSKEYIAAVKLSQSLKETLELIVVE